jgi:uncharacterized protein (DUF302 family)
MQVRNLSNYSFGGETKYAFDDAIRKVEEALKEQGFGILTQIDAKRVLKEKLDIDRRPYRILGACNPNFAHQALDMEPEIGVLLPCNVLVYEKENGEIIVSAMNPEAALSLVGNTDIEKIAKEVRNRVEAALEKL